MSTSEQADALLKAMEARVRQLRLQHAGAPELNKVEEEPMAPPTAEEIARVHQAIEKLGPAATQAAKELTERTEKDVLGLTRTLALNAREVFGGWMIGDTVQNATPLEYAALFGPNGEHDPAEVAMFFETRVAPHMTCAEAIYGVMEMRRLKLTLEEFDAEKHLDPEVLKRIQRLRMDLADRQVHGAHYADNLGHLEYATEEMQRPLEMSGPSQRIRGAAKTKDERKAEKIAKLTAMYERVKMEHDPVHGDAAMLGHADRQAYSRRFWMEQHEKAGEPRVWVAGQTEPVTYASVVA